MGLSSSQARLLTLTSRMHDIEYKAAKLEAQKLQMANESRKAYDDYLVALDATKIQMKTINTDGSLKYIDATYDKLINAGYEITFKDFGYGLDHDIYENFVRATHNKSQFTNGNKEYFAALQTGKTVPAEGILSKGTDGAYEVYTSRQLAEILNSNRSDVNIRLMTDIDLSGETFNPSAISNCTLDGNGHTITGLSGSLFNGISNSTISNLRINGNVTSGKGLLANTISNSTLTNISATGSVTNHTDSYVGGIAGYIGNSSITYCAAAVNVDSSPLSETQKGGLYIGGFAGVIENCATVENCSATGSVSGARNVGGFAGRVFSSTVKYCSSDCVVVSNTNQYPATYSPVYQGNNPDSGGFCGAASDTTFDTCVAKGSVTDKSGISLDLPDAAHPYNKTSVVSGFLGCATGASDIIIKNSDCYVNVTSEWTTQLCGFASAYTNGGILEIEHCNYYGSSLSTDYTHPENSSFASSSPNGSLEITDCYSSNNTYDFVKGSVSGQTTNASSAYINTINVDAPTIQTNKSTGSEGETWRVIFDNAVAKGGTEVFDLSDANPYGLNEHKNDCEWITNLINEGYAYIYKVDTKNNTTYQVSVATDTGLQEVSDEKDLRKAEAKYEADMKKIDMKDRRYDTQLAALDNERNAIKSEMETLKTVAKDNVERTFKLFS